MMILVIGHMSIVYDSWLLLLLLLSNDKDYYYDGYDYYPKQKNDDRRMIFSPLFCVCVYIRWLL